MKIREMIRKAAERQTRERVSPGGLGIGGAEKAAKRLTTPDSAHRRVDKQGNQAAPGFIGPRSLCRVIGHLPLSQHLLP